MSKSDHIQIENVVIYTAHISSFEIISWNDKFQLCVTMANGDHLEFDTETIEIAIEYAKRIESNYTPTFAI